MRREGRNHEVRRYHNHGDGHEGRRGHRGNGKGGGRGGRGRFSIPGLLEGKPNAMILFVGALGCTRHRGFQMGDLMREGKMALLCPTATDFATGRYLHQIVDAMVELKEERGVSEFVLMYGCQIALLSTDFDLIMQEAKEEHGITVTVREVCHLCQTEAAKKEKEAEGSEAQ